MRFFYAIIGPVKQKEFTRTIILENLRRNLPGASLIVAKTISGEEDTEFKVGLKVANPPKRIELLFRLHKAFPHLKEGQLQLEKFPEWEPLCNRIMREDPEYLEWSTVTSKIEKDGEMSDVSQLHGRRGLERDK